MIEDFWDWLPKAYGEVGDEPVFTKYDMEVAFAAGAETEGKRIEQAEREELKAVMLEQLGMTLFAGPAKEKNI